MTKAKVHLDMSFENLVLAKQDLFTDLYSMDATENLTSYKTSLQHRAPKLSSIHADLISRAVKAC